MEINWTDHVRNEDILDTVEEEMNILHKLKKEG